MKSICIKSNNPKVISYLLEKFETFPLQDVIFHESKFCHFRNVIIHYVGNGDEQTFFSFICHIITECILLFYEEPILHRILRYNYFYFNEDEQNTILQLAKSVSHTQDRSTLIFPQLEDYLANYHSIVLYGFANFRIKEYEKILNQIIDEAVNQYIIEKEYFEFIHLLQVYIHSQEANSNLLHLIYSNGESVLLDEHLNHISFQSPNTKAKYLSDITFSSNDNALNTLLNLLPKHLEVHIIDQEDEFIQTLKSVFEERIHLCKDCSICSTYKHFLHVRI